MHCHGNGCIEMGKKMRNVNRLFAFILLTVNNKLSYMPSDKLQNKSFTKRWYSYTIDTDINIYMYMNVQLMPKAYTDGVVTPWCRRRQLPKTILISLSGWSQVTNTASTPTHMLLLIICYCELFTHQQDVEVPPRQVTATVHCIWCTCELMHYG